MEYRIKTDQFEGPLDLLLRLIEERELDITRLSLAQVTDQYVEYVSHQEVSMEQLSDFLSIAAKLLLIKSKALLPVLELTDEEEEEIEDLEWRLLEYKRFKEVSQALGSLATEIRFSYEREAYAGVEQMFTPKELDIRISASQIFDAFGRVLDDIPDPEKLKEKIIQQTVSLEERIGQIREYVLEKAQTSFSDVVASKSDRLEVVLSFLAILELVRQRVVFVEQDVPFSDFRVTLKQ